MKALLGTLFIVASSLMAQETYDQLLRHWAYDKTAPLNFAQQSVRKNGDINIYDITYSAPVGNRGGMAGPNAVTTPAFGPAFRQRTFSGSDLRPLVHAGVRQDEPN